MRIHKHHLNIIKVYQNTTATPFTIESVVILFVVVVVIIYRLLSATQARGNNGTREKAACQLDLLQPPNRSRCSVCTRANATGPLQLHDSSSSLLNPAPVSQTVSAQSCHLHQHRCAARHPVLHA